MENNLLSIIENNLLSTNSEEIYNDKYIIQYIKNSFDNIINKNYIFFNETLLESSYINKNIIHNVLNIVYINNNCDENDNN